MQAYIIQSPVFVNFKKKLLFFVCFIMNKVVFILYLPLSARNEHPKIQTIITKHCIKLLKLNFSTI